MIKEGSKALFLLDSKRNFLIEAFFRVKNRTCKKMNIFSSQVLILKDLRSEKLALDKMTFLCFCSYFFMNKSRNKPKKLFIHTNWDYRFFGPKLPLFWHKLPLFWPGGVWEALIRLGSETTQKCKFYKYL